MPGHISPCGSVARPCTLTVRVLRRAFFPTTVRHAKRDPHLPALLHEPDDGEGVRRRQSLPLSAVRRRLRRQDADCRWRPAPAASCGRRSALLSRLAHSPGSGGAGTASADRRRPGAGRAIFCPTGRPTRRRRPPRLRRRPRPTRSPNRRRLTFPSLFRIRTTRQDRIRGRPTFRPPSRRSWRRRNNRCWSRRSKRRSTRPSIAASPG